MKRMSLSLRVCVQRTFLVWLVGAVLITLSASAQTVFARDGQEKKVKPHLAPSAFIYQGQLKEGSVPAEGSYDFQFTLYTAQTGGDELGSLVYDDLVLSNGLFKVELDFGRAALNGQESWLEVAVRLGGSTDPYTVLSPRQRLTPVPYAIFAQAESWSLIGVPIGFADRRGKDISLPDNEDVVTGAKISSDQVLKNSDAKKNSVSATTEDQAALAGTPNFIAKFDPAGNPTANSIMFDTGSKVGIGTTNPGAQLHVSSTIEPVLVGDPPRPFRPSVTQLAVSTVSLDRLGRVLSESTNLIVKDGNVGIGTANPATALTIHRSSPTEPQINVFNPLAGLDQIAGLRLHTASGWNVQLRTRQDASWLELTGSTGIPVHRWNAGNYHPGDATAFITGSGASIAVMGGSFGIGTTRLDEAVPFHLFSLNNPTIMRIQSARAFGAGRIEFWSDPQGSANEWRPAFIQSTDNGGFTGGLAFFVNGTGFANKTGQVEVMRLVNGNVGIGTANPQTKLDVAGTARTGVLQITGGSDLAEPFDVSGAEAVQPGMVVAIDPEQPGRLRLTDKAYDRTVAGIVSGANGIKPGLTMKQEGTVADGSLPVSLTGRVYCWADASYGPIEPGDLLTTSNTPGHAMKVKDHKKAQGAIIGKAMSALKQGKGLVLVLVALQ